MILNRAWTGKTGTEALPDILQAGISETRFAGTSDIGLVTNMRIVRTSVLGAIIGDQDNSFINRWGGEIERDNFTVNMLSRLGADNGATIEYRKNLTGLIIEEDDSELANRIIPTGLEADDTVIMLPEVYIDSDRIAETPIPHIRHIHFSDVKVGVEDEDGNVLYVDANAVKDELRARVAQMYEQGVDLPFKSATVEFVDLSQTEEYKNYAILETVEIGDTVKCKYKNTLLSQRVVSYDYDSLTKKYISIVLGNIIPLLGDSLWAQDLDLSALRSDVSNKLTEGQAYNNVYMNHTDGFVASAVIDEKTINVKMNGQNGLAIYDGDTYIGGVAVVNGEVVNVSNILTNDIDGNCYAKIGDVVISGVTYKGILIYDKVFSSSDPAARIVVNSLGGIQVWNGTGLHVNLQNDGTFVAMDGDNVENIRILIASNNAYIATGGNKGGVDSTGVYKSIGGTKTYL